jgi:hypothetical protein
LLQIPSQYRPSGRPHIFLFSTRRSGSTLLRDILYSQPGFNYIDQPFDFTHRQYNPYQRYLPQVKASQFVSLTEEEKLLVEDYMNKLLNRKYVVRSQWQIKGGNYQWIWDRFVVKILNAKPLIKWFQDTWREKAIIVYMTRHPIANALSVMRRDWELSAEAHLTNRSFVEENISDELYAFSRDIQKKGTTLEKHVLDWCLENLVPLRLWERSPWFTISYEKIVSQPEIAIRRICKHFGLPDRTRMLETINRPTRTAFSSSEDIRLQGAQARLSKWLKEVDEQDLHDISVIFDRFQLGLYKVDDPFPLAQFDHGRSSDYWR